MAFVRSPLVVSIALFAVTVAVRFTANTPQGAGVLLLLIGPIFLVTRAYRPLAGAAMAAASLAVFLLAQEIDGTFDPISTGTRAFVYFGLPLTIWLVRKDDERQHALEVVDAPRPRRPETGPGALTQREREVLALVGEGHTSVEIAEMLVLSVRTIESHRASIRKKLGKPSQEELAEHARLWGVFPSRPGSDPANAVATA